MNKKKSFLLMLACFAIIPLWGQQLVLSFPALAEKNVTLYYFSGAQVDSIAAQLDGTGKARLTMPTKNYRGMAVLVAPEAGGVELVVAEPVIEVLCSASTINDETVQFPGSEENNYLRTIFFTLNQFQQKQAWLQAGEQFELPDSLVEMLKRQKQETEQTLSYFQQKIEQSPLYAARYYQLVDFLNRLFEAEQASDKDKAKLIEQEMENKLDIASLYRSGRLWESVHNFYLSLFNHTGGTGKQEAYSQSIRRTLSRLQSPCREAYLAASRTETYRFGWKAVSE